MEQTHSKLGHPGVYKTLSYLKKFYYWKTMAREVKRFVLTCDLWCQRVKHLSIAMEGPYQLVNSEALCDLVTVDFYGPLPRGRGGVEYLFVVLDAFSKLVRIYAIRKTTTAAALKKCWANIYRTAGCLKECWVITELNSRPQSGKMNWKLGGLWPPAHLASLAASTPPVYVKTSFLHNRHDRNTQENHWWIIIKK